MRLTLLQATAFLVAIIVLATCGTLILIASPDFSDASGFGTAADATPSASMVTASSVSLAPTPTSSLSTSAASPET